MKPVREPLDSPIPIGLSAFVLSSVLVVVLAVSLVLTSLTEMPSEFGVQASVPIRSFSTVFQHAKDHWADGCMEFPLLKTTAPLPLRFLPCSFDKDSTNITPK